MTESLGRPIVETYLTPKWMMTSRYGGGSRGGFLPVVKLDVPPQDQWEEWVRLVFEGIDGEQFIVSK